jgi:hypothetical protein
MFWEVSLKFCGHAKFLLCGDMTEDQGEDAYFKTATRASERMNTWGKELASSGGD